MIICFFIIVLYGGVWMGAKKGYKRGYKDGQQKITITHVQGEKVQS